MSKLHVEPAETDNSFGHITYAPYRNAVEISWSPDSHWIAYYWGGSPTLKYIAFAGLNGIQKQQGELPTDIWGMSFGGWSTDNKYLALELGQQSLINLSVWTVPDLQPINLGVPAPIATPNYVPFQGADSPYPSDVVWSKQGHKLAYFTGGGTAKRQLVILSLDEAVFRRFDLSPTNLYVNQFPYWSPDGNYIAIVSRLQQADRALLDIFSVDGTTHLSLGEVVISVIVAPEFIRGAGHVWTRDEKAIVYVRSNPQGTYDVVRYNVATRKEQLLLTTKQDIAIRSSPDNQSVAILTETGTYLDGGNGSTPSHSSLGRVKFNTIEWVNCD
ncbi:MAG: hypothetical protein ABI947_14215 [Chloroflexota bacterium]